MTVGEGTPRRVIIDTDPGIDDALAIALAMHSPELRVEAITTVCGNVNVDLSTRNALLVLEALGVSNPPPVARGAHCPLHRKPVDASHVHGEDGLGGITGLADAAGKPRYAAPRTPPVKQHAVDLILETVERNPGEITIIALGPLTNIALAIERDLAVMRRLRELVIMGGSLSGIGNVTPAAEFNFHVDPHAAQRVLRAGIPTILVGLDVTEKTLLAKGELEERAAESNSAAARFVTDVSRQYFAVAEAWRGVAACPLHDPLAVGVAIDDTFVQMQDFEADVETEGTLTTGMLVADRRNARAPSGLGGRILGCVDVDQERFVEFFLKRVLAAGGKT